MAARRSIRFVLVRPTNGLNIGAVARAMANFGLDDLFVVDPPPRRWRTANSALYGSKLLANAKIAPLEEALADRDLVLGTASAHDRALRRDLVPLPSLKTLRGRRIAVLFGSERDGLTNEELSHCRAVLRIPTDAAAPSMNLGQAAALIAYEWSRQGLDRSIRTPATDAPDAAQLNGLVEAAMTAMEKARVNAHLGETARRRKAREGLVRWKMSRADASWLRGLFERLAR